MTFDNRIVADWRQPASITSRKVAVSQQTEITLEKDESMGVCRLTPGSRCFPIAALAVSRALRLGLHSSGSYGYHFRSSPAPARLRNPPASVMPVTDAG